MLGYRRIYVRCLGWFQTESAKRFAGKRSIAR
jgi:hypothetical protein